MHISDGLRETPSSSTPSSAMMSSPSLRRARITDAADIRIAAVALPSGRVLS